MKIWFIALWLLIMKGWAYVAGVEAASDAAFSFDRHCWGKGMVMGDEDGEWMGWMLDVGLALWDGR